MEEEKGQLFKRFVILVRHPIEQHRYVSPQPLEKQEILKIIQNPNFDRYYRYLKECMCGCPMEQKLEDIFDYGRVRLDALYFLRLHNFFDGHEDFLLDCFYNLIQKTGIENIPGQSEKIDRLISYMWDWLDDKSILDYRHHQYFTSILHSILYGHHTNKQIVLVERFLDLWDKYYPDEPLPEAEDWTPVIPGEDPQTIEFLLTIEVMPVQLERVLKRPAYTSAHLVWNHYNHKKGSLEPLQDYLKEKLELYDRHKDEYIRCVYMLHQLGGMPLDWTDLDQAS